MHWLQTHTHTHTCLTALFPGLPGWAGTRKVKPIWILLKQEIVSGSGISWAICKSAPRSRQITTLAPHHSVFYRPNVLPTASKHWRQKCADFKHDTKWWQRFSDNSSPVVVRFGRETRAQHEALSYDASRFQRQHHFGVTRVAQREEWVPEQVQ